MKQRIVLGRITDRIAALGRRPDFWLVSLLLWTLFSASRSLGTPWAQAALTEALRWSAGIGLALSLGWFLRQTTIAGQFLVTLTAVMALFGILDTGTPTSSGMIGPYHDHQLYGSVLLLLLPFSAGIALTDRQPLWRWGAFAALTAGALCLLLSQTRSAWAGLVAASLVFGWLWLRRSAYRPERLRIILVPAAILLVGLGSVWVLNGPAEQRAALTSRAATLTALSQDGSWQSRQEIWRGVSRLIAAHPMFGIGLGRYPGEQWRWTHVGGPLAPFSHPSLTNQAHSFYGQTTAETGLIGLGLYLAVVAAFAIQTVCRLRRGHVGGRERSRPRQQEILLIAALSALAGQGVDAVASPSWQFPEVSFFFWVILGVGLAALRPEAAQSRTAHIPSSIHRAGQWALSGSVAVVLTAQVLPMGLLTPVEAYDHPATLTYKSSTLAATNCASKPIVCFSLTAYYSDGSSYDATFDSGGLSNTPSSFSCSVSPTSYSPCHSLFKFNGARNQLVISSSEIGKALYITGSFEDGSFTGSISASSPHTYTRPGTTLPYTPPATQ